MSAVDRVWYGAGLLPAVARAALAPASWLYAAGAHVRSLRFALPGGVQRASVPVLSLGNLSVGGTGKTPVAAWVARRLRERGAHPGIVMRGYGDDEPLVHARLNPDVPVVVDADRARGAQRAHDAGCDCVILDDGFQHRRLARDSDWVLIAAERWRHGLRQLPAGPLREPESAMARAHVVVVTRKSASMHDAAVLADAVQKQYPALGVAVCHLAPAALVDCRTAEEQPLTSLEAMRVVAVAAVGEPVPFFEMLRGLGAHLDARPYRDHHAFTPADVASIAAAAHGRDGVVCTLKDAVKLAPVWPANAAPLWYVSQIAVIEQGGTVLDDALETVLAARQLVTSTAGSAGPSSTPHGHRSSTAD